MTSGADTEAIISPSGKPRKPRCILFLQGHPSGFWGQLADGLRQDGHRIRKVNFCLADRVFWGARPAATFRGRFQSWRGWLEDLVKAEGVTDILYYADRHPYHVTARAVARDLGIGAWAVEFGYLRPDWLTFEPGGMGAHSLFPRTPEAIAALAEGRDMPDMEPRYVHGFGTEAFHEVAFHLLQVAGRPFYPHYVSDKTVWPAVDYLSWVPQLAISRVRSRQAVETERRLRESRTPYNLVAMQIEPDYQIRASSPYRRLIDFLGEVLRSFVADAPAPRHLVVKIHPLDNGLGRWFTCIPAMAAAQGVGDRVHVIRGGDLGRLIAGSMGVVLVNSTVGIHALRQSVPVKALGTAIYDVPGLAHQGPLGTFWTAPDPVDPQAFDRFQRALGRIQVKGSFYNPEGREAAIATIRARLATDWAPLAIANQSFSTT